MVQQCEGVWVSSRDDGPDVFIHYRSITTQGYKSLQEGDKVEFEIVQGQIGTASRKCNQVLLIGGAPPGKRQLVRERYMTTKRRTKRTKSVIPVRLRIAGNKDSCLAHTVNVTNHGVQLGGFQGEIKVGDTVVIQYRHKQAQFRITWIAVRTGSLEKQIGATCLEPEKQLWGTVFPEQPDEYEEKT